MRHLVRVLVAATSVLAAVPFSAASLDAKPAASPRGGGGSADVDSAYVQRLLYRTAIGDFTHIATARIGPDGAGGDTWFDWSTDLCSAPLVGNSGRSFNFTDPCRRHDFGYRNTRLLDRRYGAGRYWNGNNRKRIDLQFLADMKHQCRRRRIIDHPTCFAWAGIFYSAVRIAGGP